MALVLPPPTNGITQDGLNGHSAHVRDETLSVPSSKPNKYIEGLIYPPPDIRSMWTMQGRRSTNADGYRDIVAIIDRTAAFVARSANPPQFEEKIREKHRQDPKFSFVNPTDSYHPYYRHRIDKIQSGEEEEVTQDDKKEGPTTQDDGIFESIKSGIPREPPPQEFVLDKPSITALDL